ncbi:MAG: tandem-95 repeat protein [Sterolibacteriaceae bacterium]|nr:tandem-95 repeat protein [Sterolibacteriaceae bacterium]
MRKPAFFRRKPILEELEPRILYSADAQTALLGADDFFHQAEVRTLEPAAPPSANTSVQFEAAEQRSHELVFIDKRVDDYQLLVDDLLSGNDGSRQVEIFLLDPNRDGLVQIGQVLAQRHDISAVHLISHGADGNVELGSGKLNFDTLIKQAAQIKAWGDALTDDADLLIYGCDVAEHADGKALVDALARLTGADVAASTNLTGNADLGGDWNLEYQTAKIEAQSAISESAKADLTNVLALAVDASSSGSTPNATSVTVSHTTSGSNRLMLVGISLEPENESVTSVTYNGVNLTLVGREDNPAGKSRVEIWQLVAPATGTHDVVVNLTAGSNKGVIVGVTTFTGVNQINPTLDFSSASGNSTAASTTLASATNDLVFGVVHSYKGTSVAQGGGQTEYWDISANNANGGGTIKAGAASVTSSWTVRNDLWSVAAVAVQADTNSAQIALLTPVQDSYLQASNPTTNSGSATSMVIDRETNDLQRALVQFDLSSIPTGATISSATMNLNATQVGGSIGIGAYQVLQSWAEASTTWNQRSSGSNWSSAGGTYNATATDSITATALGVQAFNLTGLVQAWSAGTQQNYGMLVGSPDGGDNRTVTYDSREGTVPPVLRVIYTLPANAAPSLDAGKSPVLSAIGEDAAAPVGAVGTLVSALVDFATPSGQVDNVTDVDAGALLGIAVTAADTGNGSWYYSTNNGSNWNVLGAVTNASARLLAADANTRLYFRPNADFNGTLSSAITFRAWDQTSGTAGATADTSTNGGTTAFSSATDTAALTVTAVNDAPVLADAALGLTVAEDAGAPSGVVGSLVSAFTGGISDPDGGVAKGIAIVASNESNGTWYYSTNGGSTWTVVGTVNSGSSLLLADNASTRLYFAPGANYNGVSAGALTIRAWDTTSGTVATKVSTASTGGITAFSAATDAIDVTVTAVNDAPTLGNGALAAVNEDSASPVGQSVGTIFSGQFTDIDAGASFGGIAVVGNTANAGTQGSWQYSTNGGTNWFAIGTVADNASALAISSTSLIRFVPVADYNGAPPALTVRGLDNTHVGGYSSTAGSETRVNVNSSVNGGSTAIAAATASLSTSITPVNDAPVLTTSGSTLTYTENQAATAVDAALTVSDVDSTNLAGATVTISANYANGQDVLAFTNQLGITGSWTAGTGILTLSGTTTVANYQTALRSVTYANTSDDPSVLTRTISVVVSDGGLPSSVATRDIAVSAVNDPPAVFAPAAIAVIEDLPSAIAGIVVHDVDAGGGSVTATFTVSSGTLSASSGGGVVVGGSAIALTLTGSISNLNAFLGANSLSFTTALDDTSAVTLGVSLNDAGNTGSGGPLSSGVTNVTLNVTPVDDTAPVANADAIVVAEGGTATSLVGGATSVMANDGGLSDTPVNVSLVTNVTHGTLTLNADGSFSYTHDGSENFSDSFSYRLTDNDGQTSTATVSITISPVSDATPVANADAITVAEGGTATSLVGGATNVKTNDSGLSDTPVNVSVVSGPAHASAFTLNADGSFSYTHDGSENFSDSFTYRLTDNDGQTSTATVSITISPVSDTTPVASDDAISVAEGGTATSLVGGATSVMANDSGLSDTPVNVSVVSGPAHASAFTLNADGSFSYTHDGSENFSDSFSYQLTDNDGQTSTATVSITISPVSDTTPVASDDAIAVAEGGTATALVGGATSVMANDSGLSDTPVNVSVVSGPAHASAFTLNADGSFSYTHDGSENFSDSFSYQLTDNDGQTSTATVSITISPVSDATPVASDDAIAVAEGGTATALVGGATSVMANDSGLSDTPVNVSVVSGPAHASAFTLNADGSFSYTHDGSENFSDSFSYQLTDNDGQVSDATVNITITPVSDTTPVANADAISVAEGGTATSLVGGATSVMANDSGLSDTPVNVSVVTDVTHGTLTLNADGSFSYTHDGSENFSDSFSYRLTDNDGQSSDATVSITISPVSDTTPAAVADAISVAEGGTATSLVGGAASVMANDSGLSDTPVNVSLVNNVTHGSLGLNADGTFSYTHDGSENFSDSFTYRLTDNDGQTSTATVSITISPVSDTTPAANADAISVAEGGTATSLVGGAASVMANDTGLSDTPVNVSLVTDVAHGSLTLNADGSFSYTHDGSENFSDSFSYQLTDNDGQTSTATVSITISPVSDATPVASDDAIAVAEGGTATSLVGGASSVMANDSGLSDTPVNVSVVSGPAHASAFTLNADGSFSYTHDGSENFADSFSYRLTDNDGQVSEATVNITISPVSDTTPVASDDAISVAEGGTATSLVGGASSVMANDGGLADTPVNVSLVSSVAHGTLTLNADGSFSYTHDGSENFSDSFSYRLTDNDGQSSTATVSITISPVSDATPVASDDAIAVAEGGTATSLVGGASSVMANDSGLSDTPVNVSVVSGPAHASAFTLNADGSFSYTHDGSENFSDSFSYRLTDNDGQVSDATINITITPVSDTTPVASDDAIAVAEGGTATSLVGGAASVMANDGGLADTPVNVSLVSGVAHGSLTLNADGSFSYTHDGSENFSDSFSYQLSDNDGETSTATVSITISPVSDTTPVASDDAIAVAEGGTATSLVGGASSVMANDTGLSDTPVNVSLVSSVAHGTLTLNADGSFSYTHDGTENFSDSFSYQLTDNDGQVSEATVNITITPVSDTTPVASDDAIAVAEGGTATTLVGGASSVMANDSGLSDTPVNVSLVSSVAHGTLTLNADGSFSYTHDGSENFSDSFTYRLTDNDGQVSDATVSISITPVSDTTPAASDDAISVAEGGTATTLVGGAANVKTNDTGLADSPVNVSLVSDVSHGTLTLNADGSFSYTHDGSENFSDSFSYQLTDNDGQVSDATVSISITPVSDTTPAANADAISVAEGGTATTLVGGASSVMANDTGLSDSPVNVSLVTDVSHGSLTLNADGTFSYTHDGSENFSDSFSYRLTDNDGQSSDATVSITISPVSDTTPAAVADAISVAEGGTATSLVGGAASVMANDSGLSDTPVNVSLVSDVSHGSLTLNADGTFSYVHDGSENFSDSFSYRLTDNDGQTSTATVSITISPVSDTTPAANADAISVAEGGTATSLVGGAASVMANDTGLSDTPVNVSLVTDVAHGSLTLNADGSFSYTHDGSENFSDSFSYQLTDNDGQTSTATVSITISPVSDATPVASDDAIAVAEGGTATSLVGGATNVKTNDTGLSDTPVNVSLVTDVSHGSLTSTPTARSATCTMVPRTSATASATG